MTISSVNKNKNFFSSPIGSGPFRYVGRQEVNSHIEFKFEQFRSHHGKNPLVANIVLRVLDEKQARKQAAQRKVHDLASFPLTGNEEIFSTGQDKNTPIAATWIIGLNTRLAPL